MGWVQGYCSVTTVQKIAIGIVPWGCSISLQE